jgi:hypothetical protein
MKYCVVSFFLMTLSVFEMKAQVDPKFQIYLCFGQSNMEGGVPAESIDMEYVDPRFQVLATDATNENRTIGNWYPAYPCIVGLGGLCPIDYFGRSMVATLPADYKVGVVAVASGGVDIRAFFPNTGSNYIEYKKNPKVAKYDCELYKRLVDMAKIAQQSGVIKGILMHQGEANDNETRNEWPEWVKFVYESLISDLGLNAAEVPLLVGEVVGKAEGGTAYKHNEVIANIPSVIPTAHVVSSAGCPGDIHFSALGYRILGKRYAIKMLELLGYPAHKDANYQLHESLRKFYKATRLESYNNIDLQPDGIYSIPVTAYFEDGHSEDVTAQAVVTKIGTGLTVNGNVIKAATSERSLVTVSYTDFTGETLSKSFYVNKSRSPSGMITDVVNRILSGDNSVNVADIVRIINDK